MKKVSMFFIFWIVLFFTNTLNAAGIPIIFGHYEDTYKIVDVKLKGANNEKLFLGYKTDSFYLEAGVYVKDAGYILGVEGEDGSYYPLPAGDDLRSYQESALLPDPLPQYNIPIQNYIIGYSLWIILFLFIVYYIGIRTSENKKLGSQIYDEEKNFTDLEISCEEIAYQLKNDGFILISDTDKAQEWKNFDSEKILEVEKLDGGKCKIKNDQNFSYSTNKQENATKTKKYSAANILLIAGAILIGIVIVELKKSYFHDYFKSDEQLGKEKYQQGLQLSQNNDFIQAFKFYEESCNHGNNDGCNNLGVLYGTGKGVQLNYFKANELYVKACDNGNINACANLAFMYEKGNGMQKNILKANELYERACNGGHALACNNLGLLYAKGNGVPQDYNKANMLYTKACDGGDYWGCANLGIMYSNGDGVKKDFVMAVQLLKKACDANNSIGCSNLGVLYVGGDGVEQDSFKAVELFKKACNLKDALGCSMLGIMYENGAGIKKDIQSALKFYEMGCGLGNNVSCEEFKRINFINAN